jgi:hypothetical protein
MNIQAHRAEYQDVEGLRGLCRQELNCQFDMMGAQLIEEASRAAHWILRGQNVNSAFARGSGLTKA